MKFELKVPKPPDAKKMSSALQEEMITAVNLSLLEMKNACVLASPVVQGTLRASWHVEPARKIGSEITGTLISGGAGGIEAMVMDGGAKRHSPPIAPIATWVRRKLGISDPKEIMKITFGIRKKFRSSGRPALKTFSNAIRGVKSRMNRYFKQAFNRAVSRMQS